MHPEAYLASHNYEGAFTAKDVYTDVWQTSKCTSSNQFTWYLVDKCDLTIKENYQRRMKPY